MGPGQDHMQIVAVSSEGAIPFPLEYFKLSSCRVDGSFVYYMTVSGDTCDGIMNT